PLDYITECIELSKDDLGPEGNTVLNLRGSPLPYLRLRELFQCDGAKPERENVVVIAAAEQRAGIAVDELLGAAQTVIKPLGKVFQGIAGIAGSTILGDGRVALIIDVPGLLNTVSHSNSQPLACA